MLFAAALLLFQTAPAQACTAMDAALPASLAAWTTPGSGSPGDLFKPVVLMSMKPEDQAKLDAQPSGTTKAQADIIAAMRNRPEPAQTGGMTRIGFKIEKAGRYGVALDQGGWIDVAPINGKSLESVQHGHGPDCSTIRKIVRFDLQPGMYRLSLTKLTKPQARVMLVTGE